MTIFEVSVKLELIDKSNDDSFARTFTSNEGFYECWEQIDIFRKSKFAEQPTITHVLNTASFDVSY
mgnify:CR=1 FL=1|jgi:phage pi2 protein 07